MALSIENHYEFYDYILLTRKKDKLFCLNIENEKEIIYTDVFSQLVEFCSFNRIFFDKKKAF